MNNQSETPTRAVVTLNAMLEGFPASKSAKLASILFDEVLFDDVWHSQYVRAIEGTSSFDQWVTRTLIGQGSVSAYTHRFLRDKWKGIFDGNLQEYSFVSVPDRQLSDKAERVVKHLVDREVVQPLRAERVHPIEAGKCELGAYRGLKKFLLRSGHLPPNTVLIGDRLERQLLTQLGVASRTKQEIVSYAALTERVPDLSMLSWNEIAELCDHRYYQSFRAKVKEISGLWQGEDLSHVRRLVHETFHEAIDQLARLARPGPRLWRLMKIILGNTTPLGWLFGGGDELRDSRMDSEGWAFFLIDLGDKVDGSDRTTDGSESVLHNSRREIDGVGVFMDLASGFPLVSPENDDLDAIPRRCRATTSEGTQCRRHAAHSSGLCGQHRRLRKDTNLDA